MSKRSSSNVIYTAEENYTVLLGQEEIRFTSSVTQVAFPVLTLIFCSLYTSLIHKHRTCILLGRNIWDRGNKIQWYANWLFLYMIVCTVHLTNLHQTLYWPKWWNWIRYDVTESKLHYQLKYYSGNQSHRGRIYVARERGIDDCAATSTSSNWHSSF